MGEEQRNYIVLTHIQRGRGNDMGQLLTVFIDKNIRMGSLTQLRVEGYVPDIVFVSYL